MSARSGFQIWPGSRPIATFDPVDVDADDMGELILGVLGQSTGGHAGLWAVRQTVEWVAGNACRALDGRRNAQIGRRLDRLIAQGLVEEYPCGWPRLISLTREGEVELYSLRADALARA